MKTFKDYLTESKKVYSFKVKVAGELPENFQKQLKTQLDCCGVLKLEKLSTTPIQESPMDFPLMKNCEVTIFEVICEYPTTSPQVALIVKEMGLDEACFRVRGSGEPTEENTPAQDEPSGEALLSEKELDAGNTKVKHKDYFGADFNKGFLKDLEKTAKQRKKDGMGAEYKISKNKQDKNGAKSPLGS
jgi:hypothetical protein